jgi:acyl-CoA thioesterase
VSFVEATTPEALGDGRYRLHFDRRWWIVQGPNGGFVAAGIVRAMEAELAAPERLLRSLTVHYPAAPREGDAEVAVRLERSGRSMSTMSARLSAGDRLLALALAAFAAPYDSPITYDEVAMPAVEPPAEMPEPRDDEHLPPFSAQWRLAPAVGEEGRAITGGWMAPAVESALDAALVVALADTWIPAPFTTHGPFAAPTIDLSVHVRATLPRPPEPVLGVFRSDLARDGLFEEDGRLWAPDGTLLAHSRQLALAR